MASPKSAVKFLFWIGCAAVIVIGALCWFPATSKIDQGYRTDRKKIDDEFDTVNKRLAVNPHPNEKTIDVLNKSVNQAKKNVRVAWEELYKRQAERVFVWPGAQDGLPQEFAEMIQAVGWKNGVPERELERNLREEYQRFAKAQLPLLVKMVDARWHKEADDDANKKGNDAGQLPNFMGVPAVPGFGAPPAADAPRAPQKEYKVDWTDQAKIQATLDWSQPPSTLRIRNAQEDLWLYKALCNIVKDLNEGTTGKHDAKVWVISAMEIGSPAVESSPGGKGEDRIKHQAAPAGDSGMAGGMAPAAASTPPPSTEPAAASSGAEDSLRSRRYVNKDGKGLSALELASPEFPEFRLMPFRLKLTMDQRKIDQLLVAFRNSVLPFEVKQVRINPGDRGGTDANELKGFGGHALVVEVRGVAYLYNPPQDDLLKLEETPPAGDKPDAAADAKTETETAAKTGEEPKSPDMSAPPMNGGMEPKAEPMTPPADAAKMPPAVDMK